MLGRGKHDVYLVGCRCNFDADRLECNTVHTCERVVDVAPLHAECHAGDAGRGGGPVGDRVRACRGDGDELQGGRAAAQVAGESELGPALLDRHDRR